MSGSKFVSYTKLTKPWYENLDPKITDMQNKAKEQL